MYPLVYDYRVRVIQLWFCFGLISESDDQQRATLSLKQRYQDKEGAPPTAAISLIFAGKELENHVTVSDLNLEDGSILFVSLPIFADRRRNDSRLVHLPSAWAPPWLPEVFIWQ